MARIRITVAEGTAAQQVAALQRELKRRGLSPEYARVLWQGNTAHVRLAGASKKKKRR